MMAVKTPTSLGSIARSFATAGIITPSDSTLIEIITWMASMLATGTHARFTIRHAERSRGIFFAAPATEEISPLRYAKARRFLRARRDDGLRPSHPEQISLVQ